MRWRVMVRACPVAALLISAGTAGAAVFTSLGFMSSEAGFPGSLATNISGDGSVVVGTSFVPGEFGDEARAFQWSRRRGFTDLGAAEGFNGSLASAASADGSVVVGAVGATLKGGFLPLNAASWGTGPSRDAGVLPNGWFATDVSADGSVFVGASRNPDTPFPLPDDSEAFRWTSDSGLVELGAFGDGTYTHADGVSGDGSKVIGWGDHEGLPQAFAWTAETGISTLSGQPAKTYSEARGIADDGQTITGRLGRNVMRWTESTGMVDLGAPGGSEFAWGLDVSADGGLIVGNYEDGSGLSRALLWDEAGGVRDLQTALLNERGVSLEGWLLLSATGVSDDGQTIVGFGIDPEGFLQGWVVTIPAPGALMVAAGGALMCAARRRRGVY